MTKEQIIISQAADNVKGLILEAERWLWHHPQTGFCEWESHQYLKEQYEKLGYELTVAGDIPGFYTELDTGRPGPTVLVLGELDSLICEDHPEAREETGAVHSCGHHAQSAALLGVAAVLKQPRVMDNMCGKIRLCAVPAEELIEIQYRKSLIKKGVIHYLGGKTEFLYRGYFDNVDMAFMVHTATGKNLSTHPGNVGCLAKRVVYKGKSAHAGGAPWLGCNALYAATLGLQAINSLRETFREPDLIRVHPIITSGGRAVNAIPDQVIIESYIRGSSYDAIKKANEKVNRALCGAALAMGANVDIQDAPGYAPLENDAAMIEIAQEAAGIVPEIPIIRRGYGSGSTDMGDLSCIMPVVHPSVPGGAGIAHGNNYRIEDPYTACVVSAKWQVSMLNLLLENGAERAKQVLAGFEPRFPSKEAYFAYIDQLFVEGDRISYDEEKTATVQL